MKNSIKKLYQFLKRLLLSRRFFWFVVVVFIFQSVWIALSFRFPMLYDEAFHVDAIKLFSQQLSPFITNQPISYDIYGSLIGGGATLYHYLLSFPYRIISIITENVAVLVISLRLINIAIVAVGLILFAKIFNKLNINRGLVNIGLLVFVLLPIVPFISATVNYDNLLFALTAWFLIICVNMLNARKIVWIDYLLFVIVGVLASLVKATFLPVFALSLIFLTYVLAKRYGKLIFSKFFHSIKSARKLTTGLMVSSLIIVLGMFTAVYIKDIIVYGSPQPSCQKTLGATRCAVSAGEIRNQSAKDTKKTRTPVQTPDYITGWVSQMANWTNMTGSRTAANGTIVAQPMPIIYTTVFILAFASIGILLYAWRSIKKTTAWYFLIYISIGLVLVIFTQNYLTYVELHVAYAVQPRYLLTIVPIIIVMAIHAFNLVLKRRNILKLTLFILTFLLFTQGAGLVTHIIRSDETWNWNNKVVRQVNNDARKVLQPFIKEWWYDRG